MSFCPQWSRAVIYNCHAGLAPDPVVQRAMRHSSPETKRHYQLGMVDQVREGIERANDRAYQDEQVLRSYYGGAESEKETVSEVRK
jgi:hypothetical protein